MAEFNVNDLRNIPSHYEKGDFFIGGTSRTEPDSCTTRYEYKDVDVEDGKISKIKEEFSSTYVFDGCSLAKSKISWGKLNYVKISKCNANGSSFSQIVTAYGEGISDCRIEKCKIRNCSIWNTSILRSLFTGNKFDGNTFSRVTISGCDFEKNTVDSLQGTAVKLADNKFEDLNVNDVVLNIAYSKYNSLSDGCISNGRIKDCKFIGDKLERIKLVGFKFQRCYFKEIDFFSVEFENCSFIECLFDDCKYTEDQGKVFGIN